MITLSRTSAADPAADYLSWTGAPSSGFLSVGVISGYSPSGDVLRSWGSWREIAASGTVQTLDVPAFYRLVETTTADTDDDPGAVPADWTVVQDVLGWRISWVNYEADAQYALAWRFSTSEVWQQSWSPLIGIYASETGGLRVPVHFRLFRKSPAYEQPAEMLPVPAGEFVQGDSAGGGALDEAPTRTVLLSRYLLDRTEVTEALWETIRTWALTNGYDDLPSGVRDGTNYPVRGISWTDCAKWLNARAEYSYEIPAYRHPSSSYYGTGAIFRTGTSDPVRLDAHGYRFPTEAEWERAARGLSGNEPYPAGDAIYIVWPSTVDGSTNYVYQTNPLAVFRGAARPGLASVAPIEHIARDAWTISADAMDVVGWRGGSAYTDATDIGFRDLAGNVWEWCEDYYAFGTYADGSATNPTGPATGTRRVVRGGGAQSKAFDLRVSRRASYDPIRANAAIGLRAAKTPRPTPTWANMLIVYNSTDTDSAALADQYRTTRGGITNATTLGISCSTNAYVALASATSIVAEIHAALDAAPAIHTVVMIHGMPLRTDGSSLAALISADGSGLGASGDRYQHHRTRYSRTGYPRTLALVTYLTARTAADVSNYIARVAARFNGTDTVIAGPTNTALWYVFDDASNTLNSTLGTPSRAGVLRADPDAQVEYRARTNDHVLAWTNVAGYMVWGIHGGWAPGYATNGTITFSGTNWYVLQTIESYNGQLVGTFGNYGDWFAPTAFGGTNYENCPIAAVAHTDEPYLSGVNTYLLFELWAAGLWFSEAATTSRATLNWISIGDPWITTR